LARINYFLLMKIFQFSYHTSLVFNVVCELTSHFCSYVCMFWTICVHNSISNLNIAVVETCILKLSTCTAATRRPMMTTSDFMVYDSSVKLAAHRGYLNVFIPTALWNLQLICMLIYHFKTKIRLKIHTPLITNLSVSIIKLLVKQNICNLQAW
jgi:hypothetical protein